MEPGSSGEAKRVKVGDRILEVDTSEVSDLKTVARLIESARSRKLRTLLALVENRDGQARFLALRMEGVSVTKGTGNDDLGDLD